MYVYLRWLDVCVSKKCMLFHTWPYKSLVISDFTMTQNLSISTESSRSFLSAAEVLSSQTAK